MTALIIISFLLTAFFLTYIIKRFGIPNSISDVYYLLESKKKNTGILFTVWAWLAAFTLLPAWIAISEGEWFRFLAFIACGALIFVGGAAKFSEKLTDVVHYSSAGICVTAAIAWVFLVGYWFVPLLFFAAAIYLGYRMRKNNVKWLFWIEVATLCSVYLTLVVK